MIFAPPNKMKIFKKCSKLNATELYHGCCYLNVMEVTQHANSNFKLFDGLKNLDNFKFLKIRPYFFLQLLKYTIKQEYK